MKILKNAGTFEVLSKHEDLVGAIARAARTCYQSEEFATEAKDEALVRRLLKRGHHAMIEFGGTMVVRFSNISRGFTHEMVRHRLCSFAQESTRYVDESDLHVVVPPHKNENTVYKLPLEGGKVWAVSLKEWFQMNEQMYQGLRTNGWKPEDARQILPIGTRSQIVVGANVREWRHIFDMRCAKAAHWEIREVMLNLLEWCQGSIPIIFDDYRFSDDFATRIIV